MAQKQPSYLQQRNFHAQNHQTNASQYEQPPRMRRGRGRGSTFGPSMPVNRYDIAYNKNSQPQQPRIEKRNYNVNMVTQIQQPPLSYPRWRTCFENTCRYLLIIFEFFISCRLLKGRETAMDSFLWLSSKNLRFSLPRFALNPWFDFSSLLFGVTCFVDANKINCSGFSLRVLRGVQYSGTN